MTNTTVEEKQAIVFIDGQNLYHLARECWAQPTSTTVYTYPSYDVEKIANALVGRLPGRVLREIRFYTGVPTPSQDRFWHGFWSNKLRYLGSRGVYVYKGRISLGGQEKGVDVSLALDILKLTYEKKYDLAIIVSQDWDFGPAIKLAKEIARDQNRGLIFESAFPHNGSVQFSVRGIPGTTWVLIDQPMYDSCLDIRDYRII